MAKFNVGDKVKVLRQNGVIYTYFDSIDVLFEVVHVFEAREYLVSDGHVHQEVHEDDLALYTEQESPQEDDKWGPWTEDWDGYAGDYSHKIVEFIEGGVYFRHKVKKPVVKKQIEVGKLYVLKCETLCPWKCIYIEGDNAWMNTNGGTAYVWTLDGKSISLNEDYDIDFSQNPKDQVPF